jgi:ABC-2 type transport system permease protein
LIAVPLGTDLGILTVVGILGTFAALLFMTLGLSALFLTLALRSTDWQSQMAILNLLNLPLLFGSNALFPSKLMPDRLQAFV